MRCVIGTRAAMYAPVDGNALFLILDDVCYQDADGMMPYANARGVLRLRAKAHNGVFVAMAMRAVCKASGKPMRRMSVPPRSAVSVRRFTHSLP